MNTNYIFIALVLPSFLFVSSVYLQLCKRKEDCSSQIKDRPCSFCTGDINSAKCLYPFPDVFIIDPKTLACKLYKLTGKFCIDKNPCKHGNCFNRYEEVYLCRCMSYYVGRNCDVKYDRLKTFYMTDIGFELISPMVDSTEVKVILMLAKDQLINEVKVSTEDGYHTYLKYNRDVDKKCTQSSTLCDVTYAGSIRYSYKPYSATNKDFIYLGNNVLGYLSKFHLDIIHEGTPILNSDFKVFVEYPVKNKCMPVVEIRECGSDYKTPTTYYLWSEIIMVSSVRIIPDGNSRNADTEKGDGACGSESQVSLTWKIWWLKEQGWMPDVVVVEKFKVKSIVLNPLTDYLECGLYRVELEAKNVFSEGSSTSFDTCYFQIETLPLEAIIEGGTHRSLAKKEGLLLSAVKSRDPNELPRYEMITTKWSCTVLQSDEADVGEMCKPVTLKKNQPHFIPADKLTEGEYNFTLEIWSDSYRERTCQECQTAKKHEFSYQTVVISNRSNLLILCEINCGNMVSVNNDLILKVSYILSTGDMSYNWTYTKVDNGTNLLLSKSNKYPPYIFHLSEYTLEIAAQYLVSVSVIDKGYLLSATYGFETDDFIYSGNCSINPDSGVRGVTHFYIKCSVMVNKALLFEFFDKTSKEASENVYMSGRMLGTSNNGDLGTVLLTGGVLVIYITCGYSRVRKIYEVNLTDDIEKQDAMLNEMLYNPNDLQKMSGLLFLQHMSSAPYIVTNNTAKKMFLSMFLSKLFPYEIKLFEDVKLTSLLLQNILSGCGKGNMDFESVKKTRTLAVRMVKILKATMKNTARPIYPKEVRETTRVVLNILELSLDVKNNKEVDGSSNFISTESYFALVHNTGLLENILKDIQIVLSTLQKPGLPAITIKSSEKTFNFKVLQGDTKYNFSLVKMLHLNSDIPVRISPVLMHRLQKQVKIEDNLSLNVAIINKNVFKWLVKKTASSLLFISLNKHTQGSKIVNVRKINAPIDIEVRFKKTSKKVHVEVSQTIPLDPTADEDNLDLHIKVHRFQPSAGSKLAVTFLYLPTNVSLRVLVMEDYRPTYKMMISDSILISQQSPYYLPNFTWTKPDSLYYMAVIPGPGIPLNDSIPFSFTVNSTVCVSWSKVRWSNAGCGVGPNTSGLNVHCRCNHLSIFAAIFPYLPNQIDPFTDAKLFLTAWDNPIVVCLMVLLFFVYIVLSIVFFKMDKRDRLRGAITVLEDNFPDDKHPYVLAVYTSSRLFAGTSANVGVQLIGEVSNSRVHILKSKFYKVLSRGSDDWFLILCPKPLGIIKYLHLWHDNTNIGAGWYCDKVHIYDVNNCLEGIFIVEQWIELNMNMYPEALVVPASSEDILKIDRVLSANLSKCFKDQLSITGILSHHPRSKLKRVQILNIFMCSLVIALLCSIMFYSGGEREKPDHFRFSIRNRDMFISIITLVVVVVVNYVIDLLFQKSYKVVSVKNRSSLYLRQSIPLAEFFDPQEQISQTHILNPEQEEQNQHTKGKKTSRKLSKTLNRIVKSQNLVPAALPHGNLAIQVNKKWLTLTCVTCATIIILCMYLVTLYGLKMGLVLSKKWLATVLMAFIEDRVLLDPLGIFILVVTVTTSFEFAAGSSSYRLTESEIEKLLVYEFEDNDLEAIFKTRNHPMYSPMTSETREMFLNKKVIFMARVHLILFLLSLCYIICVAFTIGVLRYLNFHRNSHLENLMDSGAGEGGIHLFDIYDIPDLNSYIDNTVLRLLYKTRWYNKRSLHHNGSSTSQYWTSDYSWRMVGVPYLRQQRTYDENCKSIAPPQNMCISEWSYEYEEQNSYSIGWTVYSPYDLWKSSSERPWTYQPPTTSWFNSYYRLQGRSGRVYNNGGYKAKFGSSIQETVKTVTQLVDNSWVDKFTKVVFVELILYNVNLGCLGQLTFILEYLTTSVSLRILRIDTLVVSCYGLKIHHICFIILTFSFILEICYGINYNGFTQFFKDLRNTLLLVIVVPSTLIIFAFLTHVYLCSAYSLWDRYYDKKHDFFNFDNFISFHSYILFLLSFFLLIGLLRTLLFLQSTRVFLRIQKLFKLSVGTIFSLLLLNFIVFIGLFKVLMHFDILTNTQVTDIIISQKKVKLAGRKLFDIDPVFFSILKFFTVVSLSSLVIAVFVHFSPNSSPERKKILNKTLTFPKIDTIY